MGRARNRSALINGHYVTVNGYSLDRPDQRYNPDHWSELAACAGKFDLFSKPQPAPLKGAGMDENEIFAFTFNRFKSAIKICSTCPVLGECERSARPEDYQADMVIAGKFPEGFGRPRGRPNKPVKERTSIRNHERAERGLPCSKGHDPDWVERKDRGRTIWRCRKCLDGPNVASKERQKTRISRVTRRPEKCKRGHNDWYIKPDGGRNCNECRRFREREQYAAERKSAEEEYTMLYGSHQL